jgi:hypothetical protein
MLHAFASSSLERWLTQQGDDKRKVILEQQR